MSFENPRPMPVGMTEVTTPSTQSQEVTPALNKAGIFFRRKALAGIGVLGLGGLTGCGGGTAGAGSEGCSADIEFIEDDRAIVQIEDNTQPPAQGMERHAFLELNFGTSAQGDDLNQYPSSENGGKRIGAYANDIWLVPEINPDEPYIWASIIDTPEGTRIDLTRDPLKIEGATNHTVCAAWEVDGANQSLQEIDPSIITGVDPAPPDSQPGQRESEPPLENAFFESAGSADCRSTVMVEVGGNGRNLRFNTLPNNDSGLKVFDMNTLVVLKGADGTKTYILSGGNSVFMPEDEVVAANPIEISIHAVDYLEGRRLSDIERPLDEATEKCMAGVYDVPSLAPFSLEDAAEPVTAREATNAPGPERESGEWEGTLELSCSAPGASLHKNSETGDWYYRITPVDITLHGKNLYDVDEELMEETKQTTITSIVQVIDENGKVKSQHHKTGKPEYSNIHARRSHNSAPQVEVPAGAINGSNSPDRAKYYIRVFIIEGSMPNANEEFEFEERWKEGSLGVTPCGGSKGGIYFPKPAGFTGDPDRRSVYLEPDLRG